MKLLEKQNVKSAIVPVDLDVAQTGARISLAKGNRVAVIINVGASTAAVLEVTLKQHTAASAGTTKDLEVALPYYYKTAAQTVFTKVDVETATAEFDLSTLFASAAGTIVFEVEAQDLDVNGGFTHFSVDIADTTAAKLGSAVYVLSECRNLPAYTEII